MAESSIRGEAKSRVESRGLGREKREKEETELVERSFMRGAGRVDRRLLPAQGLFYFIRVVDKVHNKNTSLHADFAEFCCIGS